MKIEDSKKGPIQWRTAVSLSTLWLFLVMGISGLILYVVPQGRIAYWVDWRLLGLTKSDWGNIHIAASILFAVVGGFHIYFNWRPLLNHLRKRAKDGVRIRKELWIATAAALFVTAGALWKIPPVGWLIDLSDAAKAAWIGDESDEPPFGHAELLSLKGFCRKNDIDLNAARRALKQNGIEFSSPNETLADIARQNNISPKDVFTHIKTRRAHPPEREKQSNRITADEVYERFEGTGVGRMTLSEACRKGGEAVSLCFERLDAAGLAYGEGDTVKEAADQNGRLPIQMMQLMLMGP